MSPEMAALCSDDWLRCLAPGMPSDMYSLGASVWYVMTGKRYCAENTAVNEWILSSFTAHTQHLLRGLLAADPDQRPTAEEVLRSAALRRHPLLLTAQGGRGRGRGPRQGGSESAGSGCDQDLRSGARGQGLGQLGT